LISSEIGTGTSYINLHNHTGLVVPPSDPLALRTLWDNPWLVAQMGQRAEQRYRQLFTAECTG
jgi:rhamnosyl/mannosyltransferase